MLGYHKPTAVAPPGADAPPRAPSYGPGFQKRQPVKPSVDLVAPGTIIDYDRGFLLEPSKLQVIPLENSDFERLFRGPIRNYYVRDWYWRGWWQAFRDDVFPSAHVPVAFLPTIDGTIMGLPGGTAMVPRSKLTFNLTTPAWTIQPDMLPAQSNA